MLRQHTITDTSRSAARAAVLAVPFSGRSEEDEWGEHMLINGCADSGPAPLIEATNRPRHGYHTMGLVRRLAEARIVENTGFPCKTQPIAINPSLAVLAKFANHTINCNFL
jgi:hypothetical protein